MMPEPICLLHRWMSSSLQIRWGLVFLFVSSLLNPFKHWLLWFSQKFSIAFGLLFSLGRLFFLAFSFLSFFFFFFFLAVCRVLIPWPGIEPRPHQWKRWILTAGTPENPLLDLIYCNGLYFLDWEPILEFYQPLSILFQLYTVEYWKKPEGGLVNIRTHCKMDSSPTAFTTWPI